MRGFVFRARKQSREVFITSVPPPEVFPPLSSPATLDYPPDWQTERPMSTTSNTTDRRVEQMRQQLLAAGTILDKTKDTITKICLRFRVLDPDRVKGVIEDVNQELSNRYEAH